jgi:hypothetical protein
MRFRTLALLLALGFGLSMGAEAKKKINYRANTRVTKVKKFKSHKAKHSKRTKTARRVKH